MAGFDELSKRLREKRDIYNENINKRTKYVARAIDTFLVEEMPPDTGRAKSAVVVTVGEASYIETLEAYVPGEKGSTAGENNRAAVSQAELAIESRQIGEEIHININIPYIEALNKGSSSQAAAGFIERAVAQGEASRNT